MHSQPLPGGLAAEGIRHELGLIKEMQYAPYFLTIFSIVRYARSQGIICQGRGSAANSAICYILGITSIDPETNDLLFERFFSKERDEPPDTPERFHGIVVDCMGAPEQEANMAVAAVDITSEVPL